MIRSTSVGGERAICRSGGRFGENAAREAQYVLIVSSIASSAGWPVSDAPTAPTSGTSVYETKIAFFTLLNSVWNQFRRGCFQGLIARPRPSTIPITTSTRANDENRPRTVR